MAEFDFTQHFEQIKNRELAAKVDKIAIQLSKEDGYFGFNVPENNEEKTREIIKGLGHGHENVEDIVATIADGGKTHQQRENAENDLGVLSRAVLMSLNLRCSSGDLNKNNQLLTDVLTSDQIDQIVSNCLKGIGVYVKNEHLLLSDRSQMIEVNRAVDERSINKAISVQTPIQSGGFSIVEHYKNLAMEVMRESGIKEEKNLDRNLQPTENRQNEQLSEVVLQLKGTLDKFAQRREQSPIDYDNLSLDDLNMRNIELPESPENQLKLTRLILDYVEFKGIFSYDKISPEIDFLKKVQINPICAENVRVEVKNRLSLNDMAMCGEAGDGKIGKEIGADREGSLDYIASALGKDGGINKDFVDFFFRKGNRKEMDGNGFRVDIAWDLLQDAAMDYQKLIEEAIVKSKAVDYFGGEDGFRNIGVILKQISNPTNEAQKEYQERFGKYGQINYNWFWDGEERRVEIMRQFMVEKLMESENLSKDMAEKSLQFAKGMFFASGENQYLNEDFIGGADLAKRMRMGLMRKIDYSKDKNIGPVSTVDLIESCHISYFRLIANTDEKGKVKYGDQVIDQGQKVYSSQIDSDRIDGKHSYYLWATALNVSKFNRVFQLFMDGNFDPKDILNQSSMIAKVDLFNKLIDYVPNALAEMSKNTDSKTRKKENQEKARAIYMLGQIENAIRVEGGLTLGSWENIHRIYVQNQSMPIKEDSGEIVGYTSFLTQEYWDKIEKQLDVISRIRESGKLRKGYSAK